VTDFGAIQRCDGAVPQTVSAGDAAAWPTWLLPAAACLLAVGVHLAAADNVDVSVLLTWAEKFVDGARPYVDFIEVNPPGSFLLYVPAVLVGRALGTSAEHATRLLLFAALTTSLVLVRATLPKTAPPGSTRSALLAFAVVVLVALPARTFAEREHIGAIAILPFLAVAAARLSGSAPAWPLRLAAGVGAGVALVAKPHFATALLSLGLFVGWRTRSARHIGRLEWISATGTAFAYLAVAYGAFPEFFSTVAPAVAEFYLPDRVGMTILLLGPAAMMCAGSIVLLRQRDLQPLPPESLVLLAAGVGAAAAYVLQGKGWPYQSYPAVAFLALAVALTCAAAMAAGSPKPRRSAGKGAAVALLVGIVVPGWFWFDVENPSRDRQALARTIKAANPEPVIVAITGDIAIGHPVARMVGAKWVQRQAALAVAMSARRLLAGDALSAGERARFEAYLASERQALLEDLTRGRPNVLLVEAGRGEWLAWASLNRMLADELAKFEAFATVDDVLVMRRR
jgi:hypothetical protein